MSHSLLNTKKAMYLRKTGVKFSVLRSTVLHSLLNTNVLAGIWWKPVSIYIVNSEVSQFAGSLKSC